MNKLVFLLLIGLFCFPIIFPIIIEAITVGPVKLEISVDPGDIATGELFLMNDGEQTQTFYPVFETFIEENGVKKFITDTKSDLANWFDLPSSVTLNSQGQKNIPFTLRIPNNASPGGHFAVIWWSTASPEKLETKQVSIVTRAGILVYLRVSGDIKEEATVSDFNTNKKIYWNPPVNFSITLENSGNVYLKPVGTLLVKNIFGATKGEILINQKTSLILPQSKKTFTDSWIFTGFTFGPYRANLDLVYGESQYHIQKTVWFFILPLKITFIIFGIILAVFVIIPQYNKWLIRKYKS